VGKLGHFPMGAKRRTDYLSHVKVSRWTMHMWRTSTLTRERVTTGGTRLHGVHGMQKVTPRSV
jgi:hypothetical protein